MSKIFISLYLDEDVNVLLADLLRARGFEAITVLDAGQLGKTDEEQLAYAVSQEMALLTHNRVWILKPWCKTILQQIANTMELYLLFAVRLKKSCEDCSLS